MKRNPVLLLCAALGGAVILGCGGGGGGVTGSSDVFYYINGSTSIIKEDYPSGSPFTLGSGAAMSHIRISPDKSQILFVGGSTLYVVNSNGTGLTALTGYKGGDWNSDGSKVFAISSDNKLRSMNPDGTGVSADLFDGNFGGGILSIDVNNAGTKLMIVYSPTGWERLYTLNLDGSGSFAVTANGVSSTEGRWSTDGTSLVFTRADDIYTIEADGTGEAALANTAAAEGQASFRDNNTILYIADGDIWRMNGDGTGQTEIKDGANTLGWPESRP